MPSYLPIVGLMGRSLASVLADYGLETGAMREYFDAVCQITVQTDAAHAEAPFALAATDNFFRGAGHIHGGIGRLAWAISDTIEELGGDVHFGDAVAGISPHKNGWEVQTRRGHASAPVVVANLLPGALAELLDETGGQRKIDKLSRRVRSGRADGFVGGVPRTTGLSNDLSLSPPRIAPGLYLVGDSAFPGQSTLACAIGGKQVAERILARL